MRWQADGELRIKHRIFWAQDWIVYGIFFVCFWVGDNGRDGCFGASARRGGNGKERRQLAQHLQHAAHLRNRCIRAHHSRRGNLGAVHRRAAAKCDNGFAVILHIKAAGILNIVKGRIGLRAS